MERKVLFATTITIVQFEYTEEYRFLQKVEDPYKKKEKKEIEYTNNIIHDIILYMIRLANKSPDFIIHDDDDE